mmetsp:Transcript_10199/g.21265  ORF Transcript_10199/g.21265 Transcript_10199/m.21265 type:complete len:354 (-) Transcript_10199:432-1493(-)
MRLQHMRTMLRSALTTHAHVQRRTLFDPQRLTTTAPYNARNTSIAKFPRPAGSFVTRGLSSDLAAEDARAQAYYDSDDAYNFYKFIWGGDNIHVGLYGGIDDDIVVVDDGESDEGRIRHASQRSLERMFALQPPSEGSHVMDMGAAYGGLARWCINSYSPALVSCVELSAKENARNAELTADAGLEDRVLIKGERSFTATGEPDASFDLVVSMDSFLHAGKHRAAAIEEASRVLKPGGWLVFTDIMESDSCDRGRMEAVLARIHLDDMGSPSKYRQWGARSGLAFRGFEDRSRHLAPHYSSVCRHLDARQRAGHLAGRVSPEFVTAMRAGLQAWVEEAERGNLAWGYMMFQKQ